MRGKKKVEYSYKGSRAHRRKYREKCGRIFRDNKLETIITQEKAYIIKGKDETNRNKMVIVKLKNREMKRQVITKKKRTLKRGIYINYDLTAKEREIQNKMRKAAKREKENGKDARAGYMKVIIDGKWLKWDVMEDVFYESKDKNKPRYDTAEEKGEEEQGVRMCFWNVASLLKKDK